MKKLTLVLAMVLLVAGFVFAGDPVTATLTGSATATWGVDLASQATGFTNSASASISIPLIAKATKANEGSVPYGSISLADFLVTIDNSNELTVTAPSVTAKLLLSDALSVTIFGAPSFAIGQASPFMTLSDVANGESAPTLADSVDPDLSGYTGGLTVTYSMDMITLALKVTSNGGWDAVSATDAVYGMANSDNGDGTWSMDTSIDTQPTWHVVTAAAAGDNGNTANDYSAGVDVTLTPVDMLTANFKLGYGTFSAADLVLSGKLTVKPVDMLSVWGALDGSLPNGGDFAYDASFGATVTTDPADLSVTGYYGADDLEAQTVVTVKAVTNLSLSATFEAYTLLTSLDWAAKSNASYTLDAGYKPYAGVTYYNNGSADGTLQLNAGVEASKLLANTVFKVDWLSGSDISSDIGDLEVSATVSY
ncbi:MAG: hypothetical protein GXP33_03330 [Spirochaetes bacterium]|nr:hypothetical protein [Spirochaetota bacterium]